MVKLRYVQSYKDRHGKLRCYYRRSGRRIAIKGDVNSPEWLSNYREIHESFTGERTDRFAEDTFGYAVECYYQSDRFEKLKDQTKYAYRLELERLVKELGDIKLVTITRGMIVAMRDQVAEKSPRRACEVVKVLKVVFQRACDLDMIDRDPTKDVKNPVIYKAAPHEPWPQDHIDRFLAGAAPVWRRALMVLLQHRVAP